MLELYIAADNPYFDGHFPEQAVFAGRGSVAVGTTLLQGVSQSQWTIFGYGGHQVFAIWYSLIKSSASLWSTHRTPAVLNFTMIPSMDATARVHFMSEGHIWNKTCLLVPVYDHPACLADIIRHLSIYELHCLMVNDGSAAPCRKVIREIAREHSWVSLVEREKNGGKGAAVKLGMIRAARLGYTHVLQVDADGQHELSDIPRLLALSATHPEAVISGLPCFKDAPAIRYYGRYLTHIQVWINTLSLDIRDSMCGFRVYSTGQHSGSHSWQSGREPNGFRS